jgi:hypothetical protein
LRALARVDEKSLCELIGKSVSAALAGGKEGGEGCIMRRAETFQNTKI